MLAFLDICYTFLHLVVISINLFAWIWPATRKLHLIAVALTVFSWVVMGYWKTWGYCFLTDWHWDVKRELGERNLPSSFIQYFVENYLGLDVSPATTDLWTAIVFGLIVLIAAYQHLIAKMN